MKTLTKKKLKKPKLIPLPKLKKSAWKLMSMVVRSKDANFQGYIQCFTCPAYGHWRGMDAGHFLHSKLDFDPRNIRPQCTRCNRYLHGNLSVYAERLIRENGLDWLAQLRKDAQAKGNNYNRGELVLIIENLTKELHEREKTQKETLFTRDEAQAIFSP